MHPICGFAMRRHARVCVFHIILMREYLILLERNNTFSLILSGEIKHDIVDSSNQFLFRYRGIEAEG